MTGVQELDPHHARNQITARLMLAGVDGQRIAAVEGEELLSLIRSTVLWGGQPPLTLAHVAEAAGIDLELARRARMLMGLPDPGDEAVCRHEEIEVFRGLGAGAELFGVEPILQFTRVIGSAMAQVGEGALSVFARALEDARLGPAAQKHPDRYALAALDSLSMFHVVPQVLSVTSTLLFDLATERLGGDPGQECLMAVGFVDLVRSTETGEALGIYEMAAAVSRFEERSVELAGTYGGRVVKFIGDEVMFVIPTIDGAVAVAEGLLVAVDDDPALSSARAGVAFGPMLNRDGDWFGSTVNLAARLTERARPREMLAAGDGAGMVVGATSRGRKRLKGLADRVEVFRIG